MATRQIPRRPCFFCGSETIMRTQTHAGIWRFVDCIGCGARGPRMRETKDAARVWNSGEQRKFPDRQIRLVARRLELVKG